MSSYMQSYTNWVGRTATDIRTGTSKAVGGAVSNVGKAAGGTVSGTTRGWADGLRTYGNSLKDATGASGSRAPTSSNPLGLGGSKTSASLVSSSPAPKRGSARDPLGLNR